MSNANTAAARNALHPFRVRLACGCIETRLMRESTAGARFSPERVIDRGAAGPCEPHAKAQAAEALRFAVRAVRKALAT